VRREQPIGVHLPEPIVDRADETDPEHETREAMLASMTPLTGPGYSCARPFKRSIDVSSAMSPKQRSIAYASS
jgi:hypothetical protein